jgi:hypothetical protein
MSDRTEWLKLMRSLATIGIAIAGPLTLLSGIFVFGTLWRGTPRLLLTVFLVALAATALSVVAYVAADIQERNPPSE